MSKITAIDIGTSSVKIISGTKSKNTLIIDFVKQLPYQNIIHRKQTWDQLNFKDFYYDSKEDLKNAIQVINEEIPHDSDIAITFNSAFASIYPMTIPARSKKSVKIAAEIYFDKIDSEDCNTDYQLINYCKSSGEAEIMFTSYFFQTFGEFEELFSIFTGEIKQIEFDNLALLNFYEHHGIFGENCVILDFGESKVTCLQVENGKLNQVEKLERNAWHLFSTISNRLNTSIYDAEKDMQTTMDLLRISKGIVDDCFTRYANEISSLLLNLDFIDKTTKIYISGGIINNLDFCRELSEHFSNIHRINPFRDFELEVKNSNSFLPSMGLFLEM
jgi:hypothetical protein